MHNSQMDSRANEQHSTASVAGPGFFSIALRVTLPIALLGIGWLGYLWLSEEPEKEKRPPGKPHVIKTRVEVLRVGPFQTSVETHGTIRAHNEVTLTPQVSGKIIRVHPAFEDGAFFEADELLLELDPEDFKVAVTVAEAQLARAQSAHAQEQTRGNQALLNWRDLGYEDEPTDLVLRKPQLREAEASVRSAQAQLAQAQRNLERAKVHAPFTGRVRQRSVGVGQTVGPGTPLATIFAIDYAEVRLPLSSKDMRFLELPEDAEDAPVEVRLFDALEPEAHSWTARILRTEGALEASTLELFAIARINDPFGRESGEPPLRVGQPVIGLIPGRVLEDVIAVPRKAVRQLHRIYLVDPETLTLSDRSILPLWSNEETVVIRDATIPDGTFLSTTQQPYAPIGSKVELLEDPDEALAGSEEGETADAETKAPLKQADR